MEDTIKDVKLWRILINGYPYKTIEELGCHTKEEAFSATKQAIYCYIHGNNPDNYVGIGEAGKRTLNALKTIVNNANLSSDTILSNEIKIQSENDNFIIDSIDKNYVSKIYYISSKAQIGNYKINLSGILPEGIKVTNLKNEEKREFGADEKFKISIPIINLKDDGKINISVETKTNTKPIIYGKAPETSYQDYALTGFSYEDTIKNLEDNYSKNETTIKIIKKDLETGEKISNVEFQILNERKEIIYSNLKTDENGEIKVSQIMPGKYYIKEVEAKDGYVKDNQLYEVNILLNETIKFTINNSKEPEKIKTENPKQTQEIVIKKLPKTGM